MYALPSAVLVWFKSAKTASFQWCGLGLGFQNLILFTSPVVSFHRQWHADLFEDFLDGSISGEVEHDVPVRRVAVPVDLAQDRIRSVDVVDSNHVDVHVQILVNDAAVDSLQPRQRYHAAASATDDVSLRQR